MKNRIVVLPTAPGIETPITLEKCENGYVIKKQDKVFVFIKLKDAFAFLELELV